MKWKNLLLLFTVLGIISGTMTWTFKHGGIPVIKSDTFQQLNPRPDFTFSEILISEIAGPIKHWEIKAQRATIDKQRGHLLDLAGCIYSDNKKTLAFRSPEARTDLVNSNFIIYRVTANSYQPTSDPWKLTTNMLSWMSWTKILEGKEKVHIWNKTADLYGDHLQGQLSLNTFSLRSNVRGYFDLPQESDLDPGAASPDVTLVCNALFLDNGLQLVIASQNATAYYKTMTIAGDMIKYDMQGGNIAVDQHVKVQYFPPQDQSIVYIDSQTASYNIKDRQLLFQNNVKIRSDQIKVHAGSAIYFTKDNRIECQTDVKAANGSQTFSGDKIIVYLDTKTIETIGRSKFVAPK